MPPFSRGPADGSGPGSDPAPPVPPPNRFPYYSMTRGILQITPLCR